MLSENGLFLASKRTPILSSDFFHSSSYSRLIACGSEVSGTTSGDPSGSVR